MIIDGKITLLESISVDTNLPKFKIEGEVKINSDTTFVTGGSVSANIFSGNIT